VIRGPMRDHTLGGMPDDPRAPIDMLPHPRDRTAAIVIWRLVTVVGLFAGCAPVTQQKYLSDPAARQQYFSNLTPEKCTALQSVISARQMYGIVAPSEHEDEAALQRCSLEALSAGAGSQPQTAAYPPYVTSAPGDVIRLRDQDAPVGDAVSLERRGDTYLLPVRINQTITLPFVLDTGATELGIPADVALTLIRAGALTSDDFIGKRRYALANGSEEVGDRVIIREVQVGQHVVQNVTAIVNPPASDLLLKTDMGEEPS
jgi:hypothetical protein